MATSSVTATLQSLLPNYNLTLPSKKPSSFSSPLNVSKLPSLKSSSASSSSHSLRVFAVPELLESQLLPEIQDVPNLGTSQVGEFETLGTSKIEIAADFDKMAPKQKIRIKLKSYFVPLIEDSCKQIVDAAKTTNAKTTGPVPLPTKRRIFCVLKSPHVNKDARFHFEIRTHQRLIDILYPTAQTIDSLMQLQLPLGVDVEVKL